MTRKKPKQNKTKHVLFFLWILERNKNMCVFPPLTPPAKLITSDGMKKNSQNDRLSHTAPLGGYIYFRVEALIKTIYPWLFLSAFLFLCLQTLLCSLTLVFSPKCPHSSSLHVLHLFLLWPGSVRVSELPAVISITAVPSGMDGVRPCLLGWTQFHLQPYLLSLGCPDVLQWRSWICWLSFDGLFFGLD